MNKKDLKKAALLGLLIGAAAVSAPADAHEPVISSQGMTLAHGCGTHCSGGGSKTIADAEEPMIQNQPGTSHSCQTPAQPQNNNNRRMMPQGNTNTQRPIPQSQPQGNCSTQRQMPQGNCSASRSNGY